MCLVTFIISHKLHGAISAFAELSKPTEQYHLSKIDHGFLKALNELMQDGAYFEEGLKIGTLAARLGLSEHKLRRIINKGLGYRNFPSYLNHYRIQDAKRRLKKPEFENQQILQIALDVGYGSIGPFNRAFKEETGLTPSKFRKQNSGLNKFG